MRQFLRPSLWTLKKTNKIIELRISSLYFVSFFFVMLRFFYDMYVCLPLMTFIGCMLLLPLNLSARFLGSFAGSVAFNCICTLGTVPRQHCRWVWEWYGYCLYVYDIYIYIYYTCRFSCRSSSCGQVLIPIFWMMSQGWLQMSQNRLNKMYSCDLA